MANILCKRSPSPCVPSSLVARISDAVPTSNNTYSVYTHYNGPYSGLFGFGHISTIHFYTTTKAPHHLQSKQERASVPPPGQEKDTNEPMNF
jgi:hypothetical protein